MNDPDITSVEKRIDDKPGLLNDVAKATAAFLFSLGKPHNTSAKIESDEAGFPLVLWTDLKGQGNELRLWPQQPGYEGKRAWIIAVNTNPARIIRNIDEGLNLCVNWKLCVTCSEDELFDFAEWFGKIARMRHVLRSLKEKIPAPPAKIGYVQQALEQWVSKLLDRGDHHTTTSYGHRHQRARHFLDNPGIIKTFDIPSDFFSLD